MNRMKTMKVFVAMVLTLGMSGGSWGTEIELYPTGPSADSAFLRFVDGDAKGLRVIASGSKLELRLDAGQRASQFRSVAGGSKINGQLLTDHSQANVDLTLKPGEFITVMGTTVNGTLQALTLRETPDDFSAIKASVVFYNMNAQCAPATLKVAGRTVNLFEGIAKDASTRRQVNPVKLAVQLVCAGNPVGEPVDMGTLVAGERYSIFLAPGDPADRFFYVKDAVAN
ncbi:alginate O-acetyltransferase AlgF [Alcaligenaceae bacterium]|nr:alginate O-acetyltransferase AlgF [Alcaligenaceae bacterium]